MANKNTTCNKGKSNKKNEFYTQLVDIENELRHYKEHFKGKTVLCNCDDPRVSNFFIYFALKFKALGLKRLICTCYKNQDVDLFSQNECEQAVYLIYEGTPEIDHVPTKDEIKVNYLKGDGDFRSPECIELLKEADIVCTNPPFSLFEEFVVTLFKYNKKFLIIGPQNGIKYKETFPLFLEKKMWLGYGFKRNCAHFISDYEDTATDNDHRHGMIRVSGVGWFTNLEINKTHDPKILIDKYSPDLYPKLDTYDAIDCKSTNIPMDYYGDIAVPITYMYHHCPDQFDIIGELNHGCDNQYDYAKPVLKGVELYPRIIIRRKK